MPFFLFLLHLLALNLFLISLVYPFIFFLVSSPSPSCCYFLPIYHLCMRAFISTCIRYSLVWGCPLYSWLLFLQSTLLICPHRGLGLRIEYCMSIHQHHSARTFLEFNISLNFTINEVSILNSVNKYYNGLRLVKPFSESLHDVWVNEKSRIRRELITRPNV